MYLPDYVCACISRLENAHFPCYAVGGCVRDALLGLQPHDYDLCTAATPEQIKAVFSDRRLILAGEKHGTVGVMTDGGVVEITTFRTEGGYGDNRHPDWVRFVDDITEDLARRDFTVNAMAYSPVRGLADPFGGENDLNNRTLRAVGDPETRFNEDSLRILRGVRFAVRYGLSVESATWQAMQTLAPLMDNLARERVFDELCKLLPLVKSEDLIRFAPVLVQIIPELAPTVGFDQHSPHHAYDIFTHTAHVTGAVPADLTLRWAALLHDTGKVPAYTTDETGRGHFYGHAQLSANMADALLHRLKAPNALRERVVQLIDLHMTKIPPEKKTLRRWLSKLGPETLKQMLTLQKADTSSKGICKDDELQQFVQLRQLLDEILEEDSCLSLTDLAVDGHDLMALGFSGPAIGQALNRLLELVLEEQLPNEKIALLNAVKEM
ncbi:MAG: HD domain-containing protein [Oscillospiraceae bacterium]|nr:HD domain-containing protein [Oscillospiraceae bacterium]